MTRSHRNWWIIFGVCAAALFGLLAWVSYALVGLESAETSTRAEMRRQSALRLALWRMDFWLTPHFSSEAARAPEEFGSFYFEPDMQARTAPISQPVMTSASLKPSPLLLFRSELIRLHFELLPRAGAAECNSQQIVQIQNKGMFAESCSPQLPAPQWVDQSNFLGLTTEQIDANGRELTRLTTLLDADRCYEHVREAEARVYADWKAPPPPPPPQSPEQLDPQGDSSAQREGVNRTEYNKRAQIAQSQTAAVTEIQNKQQEAAPVTSHTEIGPFIPMWISNSGNGAKENEELVYLRIVRYPDHEVLQGFLVNWRKLRELLLAEIGDLFPDAELAAVHPDQQDQASAEGTMLAAVPVKLVLPPLGRCEVPLLTPSRLALAVTWCAALIALAASAFTLRASIVFGERRSRFASAVTHELRTPLTTFRMYSEMLADGMIADEERRKLYLNTLKDESTRLAALVENVLAYARLEEGRAPARKEEITLAALLARHRPSLERRASDCGMQLEVDIGDAGDLKLFVDAEAAGQILLNLADNACKYGKSDARPVVELTVERSDGRVRIRVRDFGPGLSKDCVKGLFSPFDRCGKEASNIAGVGLGLALSRELARSMGGTLELGACDGPGACFVLTLPIFP